MRMEENEGGMSTLELRLSNLASTTDGGAELAFGADSKLKLGAALEVYTGDEAEPREIFRGHVTAIEADFKMGSPPELTVLAEDALARARMARRSKTYPDMAPADVVRAIAGDLSLGQSSPASTPRPAPGRRSTKAIPPSSAACSRASTPTCRSSAKNCTSHRAATSGVAGSSWLSIVSWRAPGSPRISPTRSPAPRPAAGMPPTAPRSTAPPRAAPSRSRPGPRGIGPASRSARRARRARRASRDWHQRRGPGRRRSGLRPARPAELRHRRRTAEGNAQLRVGAHVTLTDFDLAVRQHLLRGARLSSLRRAPGLSHRLPRRVRVSRRLTPP